MLYVAALLSAFVLTNGGLIGGDDMELIRTPHGFRPSKCVHHAPSGSILTEFDNRTEVKLPNGLISIYPRDEDCVTNILEMKKLGGPQAADTWVDYASYTTPSAVGNFTSVYTIPNQNPSSSGQLLYYFIGFQNNADSSVTIVQPVVNYCGGCGQYPNGWSMEPWNCCPNGQSWYGTTQTIAAGDSINAWIYAEGKNNNVIIGMSKSGSTPTTLTVSDNSRTFDWAACTLEEYDASQCSYYNSVPFVCGQMAITSLTGTAITPSWQTTGNTRCSGNAIVSNAATVSLYGTGAP